MTKSYCAVAQACADAGDAMAEGRTRADALPASLMISVFQHAAQILRKGTFTD
jgi:hypothetical protein